MADKFDACAAQRERAERAEARLASLEKVARRRLEALNASKARLAEARRLLSTWLEWAEHRNLTTDQFNDLVWRSQDVEDGSADSADAAYAVVDRNGEPCYPDECRHDFRHYTTGFNETGETRCRLCGLTVTVDGGASG